MTQSAITPVAGDSRAQALSFFTAALQALASQHQGPSAPPETFAGMIWHDTTAGVLKQRNSTDSGWQQLPLNFATTSQAQSGTGSGVMTAALVAQAIAAQVVPSPVLPGSSPDVAAGDIVRVEMPYRLVQGNVWTSVMRYLMWATGTVRMTFSFSEGPASSGGNAEVCVYLERNGVATLIYSTSTGNSNYQPRTISSIAVTPWDIIDVQIRHQGASDNDYVRMSSLRICTDGALLTPGDPALRYYPD